jgi:hypothetical protein
MNYETIQQFEILPSKAGSYSQAAKSCRYDCSNVGNLEFTMALVHLSVF